MNNKRSKVEKNKKKKKKANAKANVVKCIVYTIEDIWMMDWWVGE